MGRSAAAIQAEISVLETELQSAQSILASVGSDSTTIARQRKALEERLDKLYQQLDRVSGNAPMLVRGHLRGMR